jgi:hypothetical protein
MNKHFMMHIPSFIVGSLVSGGAYALLSQQLAFRERLTYQWPLAQWTEDQFRLRWIHFMAKVKGDRQQIRQQLNVKNDGHESAPFSLSRAGIMKYWNRVVDVVQSYFSSNGGGSF